MYVFHVCTDACISFSSLNSSDVIFCFALSNGIFIFQLVAVVTDVANVSLMLLQTQYGRKMMEPLFLPIAAIFQLFYYNSNEHGKRCLIHPLYFSK